MYPIFIAALFTIARKWKQPIPINRWIDKEVVVHIYNGILLSHTKECIWVSSNEVDEPRAYYTEWSKWESEKQISYISTYIWNLERWYWWTYLQGSGGDTDIENRLVDTVGEGEGGTNWETSMETYITICRIDSQCKFPVWCRELKPILYDNLEGGKVGSGREVQEVWTYVYIWLIHVDIWQKPTQYCKAIIPQLNKFVKKEVFWFHQFFVPQYKEGPYLSIVSQFRMKLHKFETYLSHLSNKEI